MTLCPPRFETPRTPGRPTLGKAAAAAGRRLGLPPMPFQQQVFDVGLEIDPDTGMPAYREVWLTIPRQNGKTTIVLIVIVQRALGWLTPWEGVAARHVRQFGRQRISYSAQTGRDAREKLVNDWKPLLDDRARALGIHRVNVGVGAESIVWENGSRAILLNNTEESGHGKTLDLAIVDEAFADEDQRRMQAVIPAQATRPGAQVWGLSTAGTASSALLKAKVAQGRAAVMGGKRKGIAYFEWSAEDDADPFDPKVWASCMPALGTTIDESVVQAALDSMLADPKQGLDEFRRAFLNQWTDVEQGVFPGPTWAAVQDPRVIPDGHIVYGISVHPERTSAAIVACGATDVQTGPDDYVRIPAVEVVDHRPGVTWLDDRMVEILGRHGGTVAVASNGPARSAGEEVDRRRPGTVAWAGGPDYAAACMAFYDLVADRLVRVRTDTALSAAVKGASKRYTGDVWVFDRRHAAADVTPLEGSVLALWSRGRQPAPVAASANVW